MFGIFWICGLVFVINFVKSSAIITSNVSYFSFSPSLFGILTINMLQPFELFPCSWLFRSIFSVLLYFCIEILEVCIDISSNSLNISLIIPTLLIHSSNVFLFVTLFQFLAFPFLSYSIHLCLMFSMLPIFFH